MTAQHTQTQATHPQLAEHERQRCEVWTRVMGYHRPMTSFNVGKQGEFSERRYFAEPGSSAPQRSHDAWRTASTDRA